MSEVQPHDVLMHLRKHGINAYHATREPRSPWRIVVILEGLTGPAELAQDLAARMPGVREVSLAGEANSILMVTVARAIT